MSGNPSVEIPEALEGSGYAPQCLDRQSIFRSTCRTFSGLRNHIGLCGAFPHILFTRSPTTLRIFLKTGSRVTFIYPK